MKQGQQGCTTRYIMEWILFIPINLFTEKIINPVIELLVKFFFALTGFASDSVLVFFAQSIHGQTCNGKK